MSISCPCVWPYSSTPCLNGKLRHADIIIHPTKARGGVPTDVNQSVDDNTNEDYKNWTRAVMLHELGHVLGLKHQPNHDIMSVMGVWVPHYEYRGTARTIYGGASRPFVPEPDDIHFAHDYHGDNSDAWEFAPNSWYRRDDGSVGPTMPKETLEMCAGDEIPFKWSFANRGTTTPPTQLHTF